MLICIFRVCLHGTLTYVSCASNIELIHVIVNTCGDKTPNTPETTRRHIFCVTYIEELFTNCDIWLVSSYFGCHMLTLSGTPGITLLGSS